MNQINSDFNSKGCLFGGVKLATNVDPDKYVSSGQGIRFDSRSKFSLPNGSIGNNVIVPGVHMSSSVPIYVLGIVPTQGLDDTTFTAEAQNSSINFLRSNRNFC